jgi:hypothetical protein
MLMTFADGNTATITADVIVDVKVKIVAALNTANDQCATLKGTMSYANSIALATELSNVYQVRALPYLLTGRPAHALP